MPEPDDAESRNKRDDELRAEIEAIRSGKGSAPESPREFTDRAAEKAREQEQ
jgi:hypothetical protein